MRRLISASLFVSVIAAGQAFGEPPEMKGLLSGPKVTEENKRPTLVKQVFGGELQRLEARPEFAAIALLTLTSEERATVEAFFTERAAAVRTALFENMDLFLQLQGARQSGELASARPVMRQFRDGVSPLIEPPLVEQVLAVLPEGTHEEFTRLVSEYRDALAKEEAAARSRNTLDAERDQMERRRGPARSGAETSANAARFELSQLIREMARVLSTIVAERRERTEALIAAVDATPEQQAQITAILRQSAETSRADDRTNSPELRAESIARIMALLTPDQRSKLRDFLRQP